MKKLSDKTERWGSRYHGRSCQTGVDFGAFVLKGGNDRPEKERAARALTLPYKSSPKHDFNSKEVQVMSENKVTQTENNGKSRKPEPMYFLSHGEVIENPTPLQIYDELTLTALPQIEVIFELLSTALDSKQLKIMDVGDYENPVRNMFYVALDRLKHLIKFI